MKFKRKVGSQPEQREWLKHMPDAGLFNNGWWLACDVNGDWCAYIDEPSLRERYWVDIDGYESLSAINLPELEGDEWKHSCISIEELAEWQVNNV